MHWLDWTILLATLGFIVGYGVWKTRREKSSESYLRGGGNDRWWAVGLSVMATQASAITFLSTPGQGFSDGLGFVQFYFGLPLAIVVINYVFIPLYYKWKVYTAYEFIGRRFDGRTRLLTAILFLVQRGMAAGITIYAPSIILSTMLGWPLSWTCAFIGVLVIIYTTSGGAKAVGVTHKQQMAVILGGLVVAFAFVVYYLRPHIGFGESLALAGDLGKLKVIDTSWDPTNKFTLWSGLIGGFFLQLAYFGTDQSQVQRYLGGQSMQQAQRGLWMNALLKIPMQFFILLIGVLVFVFYLFNAAPVHWNRGNVEFLATEARTTVELISTDDAGETRRAADAVEAMHAQNAAALAGYAHEWVEAPEGSRPTINQQLTTSLSRDGSLRDEYRQLVKDHVRGAEANDKDYIFITFIMEHMPVGIIGLLLAMIFSAGMSSTSAELSALATTSVVDVVRRERSDAVQVLHTRWATVVFGALALVFAAVFSLFENLIQAVNIIGSLFYGTILGIFLVAFFLKHVQGKAVFIAALFTQSIILLHFFLDQYDVCAVGGEDPLAIAFLWYNLIAPAVLVGLALVLQTLLPGQQRATQA